MASVAEIGRAIKRVLSVVGDQVARETGFTQRASKLTGAKFVQAMVLGWLNKPAATLDELSQSGRRGRSADQPPKGSTSASRRRRPPSWSRFSTPRSVR